MDAIELAWRGLDDETRLDVASVEYSPDGGFVATGRQSTEQYRAVWDLVVDEHWRTKLLTVDVEGFALDGGEPLWQRHLNLWRKDVSGRSQWRCEVGESGDIPMSFGYMGIARERLALFADALDVDLACCPVTNTMPIQRLGVMRPGVAAREITVAWVSLPDLSVHAINQTYASAADGLTQLASAVDDRVAAVVHYESSGRGVSLDLSVDGFGHVVTYPELAERLVTE